MNVEVQLFAVARQLAGRDRVVVEVGEPVTVGKLRQALAESFPPLADVARQALFAVGTDYAHDSTPLPEGAEVACIPPVSGG